MSDDWNNCVMVIILFIIVFIYYSYLKTLLEIKREWRNFKCNPIYMLMSSLIKPKKEEHNSNFQRCVSEVFAKEYSQTDVNTIVAQQLLTSQNMAR